MQTAQYTNSIVKRKSDRLTTSEFKSLTKFVTEKITIDNAGRTIGLGRGVLNQVIQKKGQGAPETIALIRKTLYTPAA